MVGTYIKLWLSFGLRGSVRQADNLQILGGTALPSLILGVVFQLFGLDVPTLSALEFPTYLGYGLLAWIGIRLVVGPYFIWSEQFTEAAELRLELSKPERMVLERLSRHRAKARAKLAAELENFQTFSFAEKWEGFAKKGTAAAMSKIRAMQAEAGLSEAFDKGRIHLMLAVQKEAEMDNDILTDPDTNQESRRLAGLLQRYLMGEITAEALALQLPPNTAEETQQ